MRLHSGPWSGNSYKVRLLLGLLGADCEIVEHDVAGGGTHDPEFLRNVNLDGKVPVLQTDAGEMLPESGAILAYLAEGTPFLPDDRYYRAQTLRWMFFEQYSLAGPLGRPRFYRMRGAQMTQQLGTVVDDLMAAGYRGLSAMEQHLQGTGGGAFFVGDSLTIADVALYAYPRLCPEGGYDLSDYPAVRVFLERVESLPGYVPAPAFPY
jgi:glutathione S-transferase